MSSLHNSHKCIADAINLHPLQLQLSELVIKVWHIKQMPS